MTIIILSLTAILAYLLASASILRSFTGPDGAGATTRRVSVPLAALALALHAGALSRVMLTDAGLNLSLSNSASLVTWIISAVFLLSLLRKPVDNLAVFIWPLAAIAVAVDWLTPGQKIFASSAPLGLQAHVAFSVVAYSLLTLACFQAIILAFAERRLRSRQPLSIFRVLPPLLVMEAFLFEVITVGFVLLTAGLVAGFMFVDDLLAQHLLHKTVLSVVAWLVFAVLLGGRLLLGWRGRIAIRSTIAGFAVLMLAFFGSKFVLEVLLHQA